MSGIFWLMEKLNKLKSKQFRHAYQREHIRVGIASQIRLIRNKLNISQTQLSEIVGTKQSVISRLEDPDAGSVNLNTLLKIAEAFDVSLIVKFSSFGKFLNEYQDVSPKELAVNSYDEEIDRINSKLDATQNSVYITQNSVRIIPASLEVWGLNKGLSASVLPQAIDECATTNDCQFYPSPPPNLNYATVRFH